MGPWVIAIGYLRGVFCAWSLLNSAIAPSMVAGDVDCREYVSRSAGVIGSLGGPPPSAPRDSASPVRPGVAPRLHDIQHPHQRHLR